MGREFDEYQKAAINSRKNSVVSAGAGSGKTTVLSQRYLSLLNEHKDWTVENILTLTFTKKATVEMSDRIYKTLQANSPKQAALFYKSNIKTLDSYCNSVAKLGCHNYGISPDFIQDKQALYDQLYAKALPFILKHRDNQVIKEFVTTLNYNTIAKELFVNPIMSNSTIANPINFEKTFDIQTEEIVIAWKKTVKAIYDKIDSIEKIYLNYTGSLTTAYYQKLADLFENHEVPEKLFITKEDIINSDSEKILNFYNQLLLYLKLDKPGRTKGAEGISPLLDEIRDLQNVLISLINYVYGFRYVKDLLPLLNEFQDIAINIKRTTGCLTFADISDMAVCILRDYPEIRLLEKQKYKAIMIDEFQDNNEMQRDMLFLLAEKEDRMEKSIPTSIEQLEPEKLFFVGDEKQSIYRFRGADVSVFRNLTQFFSDGKLEMTTNYRSEHALIAAFNTIFGGIRYPLSTKPDNFTSFPSVFYNEHTAKLHEVPAFEAVYSKVELPIDKQKMLATAEDIKKLFSPRVHIALYDTSVELENTQIGYNEAEAEWIALRIEELIQKGTKPSDIAVLFQKYNPQPLLERTFLRHGIPYSTEVVTGFYADGPVNDLLSYLRLFVFPQETKSYIQVLCSPFVNLTILEANSIIKKGLPFFDENAAQDLCPQSRSRYLKQRDFFENLKTELEKLTIAQIITKLWYEGGYRFETMWNKTVEMYSKLYDILFELSRQADVQNLNLGSFLDSLTLYKSDSAHIENVDIPLEQTQGVHLMTIHKSKGLEFDVVFVCGTGSGIGNNSVSNKETVYTSKQYGITINTPKLIDGKYVNSNYFFEMIKAEEQAKATAEIRRLSYVALTRAKKELYITNGTYKPLKDAITGYVAGGKKNINNIFQTIEPSYAFYTMDENIADSPFCPIETIPPYERNVNRQSKNTATARTTLLNNLNKSNPYENAKVIQKEQLESIYISPSHIHEQTEQAENDYKPNPNAPYQEINALIKEPDFTLGNFGTIAHAYMEAAIKKQEPVISAKDITGLDGSKPKLEIIDRVCRQMAADFAKSEIGIAASKADCKAEYAFRSFVDGKIIRGIIDLVFQNSDGTFTIVDYKTNQTIEPEIYKEQLSCYKTAVSQMEGVPEDKISCYLYYLRFGKTVQM